MQQDMLMARLVTFITVIVYQNAGHMRASTIIKFEFVLTPSFRPRLSWVQDRPGGLKSCLGSRFIGNIEQAGIMWLILSVGILLS